MMKLYSKTLFSHVSSFDIMSVSGKFFGKCSPNQFIFLTFKENGLPSKSKKFIFQNYFSTHTSTFTLTKINFHAN